MAALGGVAKIVPVVAWAWCRHHLAVAGALLVATAVMLVAPLAVARDRNHDWVSYNLNRGVEVESVAATTTWLAHGITGTPSSFAYRFKAYEIAGASGAALGWMVAGGLAMAWLVCRARGRDAWWLGLLALDIFLASCKVFSPQFLAWTAPLAAVVGGRVFRLYLLMIGLTVAAYAVVPGQVAVLAVIAVRNVVLVGTVGWGLWRLRRSAAPPPAAMVEPAPERGRRALVLAATRPA